MADPASAMEEDDDGICDEDLAELNNLASLNLFIKDSDGSPMDFYMRQARFEGRPDKSELIAKMGVLSAAAVVSASHPCDFPPIVQ